MTGTVDGQALTSETSVSITPRDWTTKLVPGDAQNLGQGDLPIHPTQLEGQLGKALLELQHRQDIEAYHGIVDDNGPNHELQYLIDVPFRTVTRTMVNYEALHVGSDFYLLQEGQQTTISGVTYCGRDFVTGIVPMIEAHEGTDPITQPDSHVGIYLRHVQDVTGPQVEPLVGLDFSTHGILLAIHTAAFADSDSMNTDNRNNLNSLSCEFHYFQ